MTELLQEIEALPSAFPTAPASLATPVDVTPGTPMELPEQVIWERIEAWVWHRWTEREVQWIVAGPGEWVPPLTPVNSATFELWNGSGWDSTTLEASPLGGYQLPGDGPYRIVAQVGAGPLPNVVLQAFSRLHDYFAESPGRRVESVLDRDIGGQLKRMTEKPDLNLGRAMALSGAADLLRPYRRLK